jgi:hypothetical protein
LPSSLPERGINHLEAELPRQHGSLIDNRARLIVDSFTGMVATELSGLAIGER